MAGGPGGCVVPPGSRPALGAALESERDALGLLAESHSNFLENESSRQGKAGALWETAFPRLSPLVGRNVCSPGKAGARAATRYQLATARASGG